ncbi:MAG: hypothetical protein IJI44_04070 [Erysipelotrichaceae bacterium]|nr:hypothetical protein [Erysipelotrichaceae bacterium]
MELIERIDNAFQLLCMGICLAFAIYRALSSGKRMWIITAMFYGVNFLAVLYWILYLLFYGETPSFSFISDFCWFSAYLFLLLLLMTAMEDDPKRNPGKVFWLIPVFPFGMSFFYMKWGKHLTNLAYAGIMSFLLYYSIQGMRNSKKTSGKYNLARSILIYCIIEYCLWTASCFESPVLYYFYYLFDFMLTFVNILLYFSVGRMLKDELY